MARLILIFLIILIVAVILLIRNSRRLYKAGACNDCKYVGENDGQLICWSPLFEENKVEKLPAFKPCKQVRGGAYCDFKARIGG